MKPVYLVSAMVFALVAIAHLWRLVTGAEVTIDGWAVPMWMSVVGALVPGGLAVMLWRERG